MTTSEFNQQGYPPPKKNGAGCWLTMALTSVRGDDSGGGWLVLAPAESV